MIIKLIKLIVIFCFFFSSVRIKASEVVSNSRIEGSALLTAGATLKVSYDKIINLPYPTSNPTSLIGSMQGMIEFGIDESKKIFHATGFTSIATITYITKDFNLNSSAPQVKTLEINYAPNGSYKAQAFFTLNNVSYIEITNISISTSPIATPTDLYIESSIKTNETLLFNYSTSLPLQTSMGYNLLPNTTTPTDMEIWWDYIQGSDEYELEYIYIDDYDATSYNSTKLTSLINYDFEHDATRIITHNQYYRIPLVYEKGWIIYRIRGVGKSQTNAGVRLEGTWSNAGYVSGLLSDFIAAFPTKVYHITNAHEADLINWNCTRTFAENGKQGVGVSYEDGLLKNRQSVAKLNTEDKTIVQSTLYDWQGRPAVSILPTPLADKFVGYKKDLNKTNSTTQFDKNVFDNSVTNPSNLCNPQGLTIDAASSLGAARYYSSNILNTNKDAQQAVVPDAQGMPYVQVDYYPDQTGRIKRQSMPGGTHFLGSGKEEKFYYAQPTQGELVRLFGTEVGQYTEYEKQISIDPNGQKLVTYTDNEGRTIASALMGAAPENLIALTGNPTPQTETTILTNNNNSPTDYALALSNNFFASQNETQTISYDVTVPQYQNACLPNMCLDCIYELEISIKDDCGQELLDGDLATAGFQPITKLLGRYLPNSTPQFPTTCGTNNTLNFSLSGASSFNFTVPKDGTYHLSKVLKLSTKPLLEYAEAFVKNNTCGQTLSSFQQQNLANLDFSGCTLPNCAQCSTAVNTFIAGLPNGTLSQSQQDDLYAKCALACEQSQDICAAKEKLLLKDFKPGGYFAKYNTSGTSNFTSNDALSIFKPNNTMLATTLGISGSSSVNWWYAGVTPSSYGTYTTLDPVTNTQVAPSQLSLTNYIGTYNDSYAKPWLQWHPEYCRLKFNCDNLVKAMNDYIDLIGDIKSFDEACRKGYLFPLPSSTSLANAPNASTCPSCSGVTNHFVPLNGYSGTTNISAGNITAALNTLTNLVNANNIVDVNNVSHTFNVYQMAISAGEVISLDNIGSSAFGAGCNEDKQWLMYKNLYLSYLKKVMATLEIDYVNNWASNGNTGGCLTNFSALSGYVRVFPDPTMLVSPGILSGYGNGNTNLSSATTNVTTNMTAQCTSYCDSYINGWVSSLSSCNISAGNITNVTNALKAVCVAGCDGNDPFGASNSTSAITINVNGTNVSVSSFQDVLNAYGYNTCSAFLISAPKPKGHSYTNSATTTPTLDACGCDAILSTHSTYTIGIANSSINSCVTSETDYFSQQLNVQLPYLSSYVCACQQAKITNGYNFSVLTTSAMPLPLPDALACNHCIPCSDLENIRTEFERNFGNVAYSSINQTVLTNFFNNTANMNNTYSEWMTFIQDCSNNSQNSGLNGISSLTTNQALDFKKLFSALAANNFLIPNTSSTLYTINTGNASAFFNSSLIPSTSIGANISVQVTAVGSGQLIINLTSASPAYSCDFVLTSPNSAFPNFVTARNVSFFDIKGTCEPAFTGNAKSFVITMSYTDVSGVTQTLNLTGTNSCYTTLNKAQIPTNNPPCAPYLCSNGLNVNIPADNNDCLSTMINSALNTAQTQYDNYIAAQVSQFIANYKNYCYANVTENTSRQHSIDEYHYTLYYYDRAGNLVHTVPPAGVTLITNPTDISNAIAYINAVGGSGSPVYPAHSLNSSANITSYISHNEYNSFDAPTKQLTPDAGETVYYYDHVGRLTVSQTSKQASENSFSYSLYDNLARITEVGVFSINPSIGETFDPNILKTQSNWKTYLAARPKKEVTQTYYDYSLNATTNAQFVGGQKNLRNRVSATTYEKVYDGNNDTYNYASFFTYDDHGNVGHIVQHNPALAAYNNASEYKHMEYEYELISGNVNKVIYQRAQPDQWYHTYEYDADNRLHAVYTSDNDIVYQRDAKYFYYQHGPLARTEIGEKQVQGTDYAFTIQGWVKGVNSTILNENNDIGKDGASGSNYMSAFADVHKDFAKDASSYSLNYFTNDYNPIKTAASNFLADMTSLNSGSATGFKLSADAPDLYNGNISSMVTSIYDINVTSPDNGKAKPQITGYRYDQLQRLKHVKAYSSLQLASGAGKKEAINLSTNAWITPTQNNNYVGLYEMDLSYDKMGNITSLSRAGDARYNTGNGLWETRQMDVLSYSYNSTSISTSVGKTYTINNRLTQVNDASTATNATFGTDIDGIHNYAYNAMGSLKQDLTEEIQDIKWTDAKKVKEVIRTATSTKPDIYFDYDAFGRRIAKTVIGKSSPGVQDLSTRKITHYVLDATGNTLAMYEETTSTSNLKCVSRTIYGADRLGLNNQEVTMSGTPPTIVTYTIMFGKKEYETKNHLSNIITTVSDRKIQENGTDAGTIGTVDYYTADITSTSDYYAFGFDMPGRNVTSSTPYLYGNNGQMREKETFGGSYSAEYWSYDSRIGRRWEGDPVTYPWQSSYACFDNNPIALSDVLGLWGDPPTGVITKTTPKIKILTPAEIRALATNKSLLLEGNSLVARNTVASSASASGIAARSLGFIFTALLSPLEARGPGMFHEYKTSSNLVIIGTPAKNLPYLYKEQLKQRVESGKGSFLDHQQYNELFAPPAQAPFKTQSHHVIPVNVFTKINNELVSIAMSDPAFAKEIDDPKSHWNRIPLGADVHGYHPAYETYIRNQLSQLANRFQNVSVGQAQKLLREFAGKMKGELVSKISANPGKRLNELYGGGRSTPKSSSSSSSDGSNSGSSNSGTYQNPRYLD